MITLVELDANGYVDITGVSDIPLEIYEYEVVYSKVFFDNHYKYLYTIFIVFVSDVDDYYFCVDMLGNFLSCCEPIYGITAIERHAAWVYRVLMETELDD